jgi:hypothetical protein
MVWFLRDEGLMFSKWQLQMPSSGRPALSHVFQRKMSKATSHVGVSTGKRTSTVVLGSVDNVMTSDMLLAFISFFFFFS